MFDMIEEGLNVKEHKSLPASDFIEKMCGLGISNIKKKASHI